MDTAVDYFSGMLKLECRLIRAPSGPAPCLTPLTPFPDAPTPPPPTSSAPAPVMTGAPSWMSPRGGPSKEFSLGLMGGCREQTLKNETQEKTSSIFQA